jgi:hypothetical protein
MGVVFLLMIPFLPILQYDRKKPAAKPPGAGETIGTIADEKRLVSTVDHETPKKLSPEMPGEVAEEEQQLVPH